MSKRTMRKRSEERNPYRVIRHKQIRGRVYALVFTWGEGDPHINISFKGQPTPFDTVNVCDHANDYQARIKGRDAFIDEVSQYMGRVSRETLLAEAEQARIKGAA
ncbi:hypothetical protein FDH86_gp086 [Arthrobacter phage Tank]|uniref:Uncharacterized protein n=2 Tax=Tankvirus tank TaxID=1982567 RepID=A0A0U4B795_9CAUD|nr:hypothetical protein FDH86_gp086 [Arthrobacter phage Tank]ALY10621.1 hypothetical protein TANK_86 [Arthrobacter phage Tank]ALY10870.1 hypothetical protein WILDE_88 [Arthrobacter phage Wilde]